MIFPGFEFGLLFRLVDHFVAGVPRYFEQLGPFFPGLDQEGFILTLELGHFGFYFLGGGQGVGYALLSFI